MYLAKFHHCSVHRTLILYHNTRLWIISDMQVHYFTQPRRCVIIPTVALWNNINERCCCEGRWLALLCWRICQTVEQLWGFACQIWPYLSVCCDSAPSALSCHRSDCFGRLLGVAHMESVCQALAADLHRVSLLQRETECLSSTNNTSYEDLSSYDNLPRCCHHYQRGSKNRSWGSATAHQSCN